MSNITSRDVIKLKQGEKFWFVVMSEEYKMSNPFLRHCGTVKTTSYQKPLGIFETSFKEIIENKHEYDWTYFKAKIDTSEFEGLFWRGRFDELPEGKESHDYAQFHCDEIYCMVYDDPKKKNPHEENSRAMFFTEADAKKFYNNEMKKWKRNMKTYITHLKGEIETANKNIEEAEKQILKYSTILDNEP